MELLRQEMRSLVAKLESVFPQPGSIEDATLDRLQTLCGVADQAQEAAELNDRFIELRQYWLDSIDWCSQLSREIEKLLIIQEELASGGCGGDVPT